MTNLREWEKSLTHLQRVLLFKDLSCGLASPRSLGSPVQKISDYRRKEGSAQKDAKIVMVQIGNPRPPTIKNFVGSSGSWPRRSELASAAPKGGHFCAAQPVKKRSPLCE
jgi:hypothetical protein